jgi:hypothetical protein
MNAARVAKRDARFILDPFDLLLARALQSALTPITIMGGIDPWLSHPFDRGVEQAESASAGRT